MDTKQPLNENLQPLVLCHAACTGGSMIYRLLVSAFGLVGISEMNNSRPGPRAFLPLDPEAQLYIQGMISSPDFAGILYKRIHHCIEMAADEGKRLLIREHSHRYFFVPESDDTRLHSVSWLNDEYVQGSGTDLQCLVSVRDPIDSWLGYRNSWPYDPPRGFDDYCGKYLEFILAAKKTKRIHIFKYEEMVDVRKIDLVLTNNSFI